MKLSNWLSYIAQCHHSRIDLGLDRIAKVADALQCHHFSCPVITVAGTNGKGSCLKVLEEIYRAAGYRVGVYTSPHLHQFNERIRMDGSNVDDDTLVAAFEHIEKHRQDIALSFFEFTTLAALSLFQEAALDVLLLEVGLGGRLDAVNIVDSNAAVITTIDFDHMDWLGDNRDSIGREKVGIIRSGCPVICGDPNPPPVIASKAQQHQATLFQIQQNFDYQQSQSHWQWYTSQTQYDELPLPALKCQNAATALMTIEVMQTPLPVTIESIHHGLRSARLPGRFQRFKASNHLEGIADVAHNPQSAAWLAEQLQQENCSGKVIAVVAMLEDKAIAQTLSPLIPLVDEWCVASLDVPRGGSGEAITCELTALGVKSWYNFETVEHAFDQATELVDDASQDRLLVFGSFHTVAKAATKENLIWTFN